MKKKVFRERYNNEFTFTVDDINEYKVGAIEKVVENTNKKVKPKKIKKKEDK